MIRVKLAIRHVADLDAWNKNTVEGIFSPFLVLSCYLLHKVEQPIQMPCGEVPSHYVTHPGLFPTEGGFLSARSSQDAYQCGGKEKQRGY